MARSLSNMVLKGIEQLRPTPFVKMGTINSAYKYGRQWSTTITGDLDSHEDFRPANKLANSGSSVQEVVENDVKGNHIMIYMKGVPEAPRCGFSALAVRVLQEYGIPFSARNILENTELKNGVKAFSNWPTFPQIFIKGEFVGGSDIIVNMHQSGELKEKLKDLTVEDNQQEED